MESYHNRFESHRSVGSEMGQHISEEDAEPRSRRFIIKNESVPEGINWYVILQYTLLAFTTVFWLLNFSFVNYPAVLFTICFVGFSYLNLNWMLLRKKRGFIAEFFRVIALLLFINYATYLSEWSDPMFFISCFIGFISLTWLTTLGRFFNKK